MSILIGNITSETLAAMSGTKWYSEELLNAALNSKADSIIWC